jgi:hypothetical protein
MTWPQVLARQIGMRGRTGRVDLAVPGRHGHDRQVAVLEERLDAFRGYRCDGAKGREVSEKLMTPPWSTKLSAGDT